MKPPIFRITLALALTAVARFLPADETDESRAARWEPVIVLTPNAQVFAGKKAGPKIPPGTIVYISQRKEDWLLVPRYNNWLHEKHVRSLTTALAYLDDQIEKTPTGVLHHYRAIVLSEIGRAEEAIKAFDEAIKLGSAESNVFLNRGLAWGRAGDEQRAIDDFGEAIRRDRKNARAYFNRGVLHAEAGRPTAALKDFNAALEIDPNYPEALNNRGVAHDALGKPEKARADYDRAIELRPRYPGALTNRGYHKQLARDYQGAIEDYGRALQMAPDAHPTLNDLAWLLATCPDENIRNGAAALKYAERANELTASGDAEYLDTLAAAAAEAGDFKRAIETTRLAIEVADKEFKRELQSRLAMYREQRPYHESGSAGDSG